MSGTKRSSTHSLGHPNRLSQDKMLGLPLHTIGSFLLHNGHPLRQLDKAFSVREFGTMTCR